MFANWWLCWQFLIQQPKLFDGYKFYFMGDFIPSYKGYLQELVVAAGGIILHRKPVSCDQKSMLPDTHSYQTFIVYSLELPDKCKPSETDTICRQRCHDAEVVASSTGSKVVTNTWILNSIAACKVECLAQWNVNTQIIYDLQLIFSLIILIIIFKTLLTIYGTTYFSVIYCDSCISPAGLIIVSETIRYRWLDLGQYVLMAKMQIRLYAVTTTFK